MPAKKKDSRPKKFSQRWDDDLIEAMGVAAKWAGMSKTAWLKALVRREVAKVAAYSRLKTGEIPVNPQG